MLFYQISASLHQLGTEIKSVMSYSPTLIEFVTFLLWCYLWVKCLLKIIKGRETWRVEICISMFSTLSQIIKGSPLLDLFNSDFFLIFQVSLSTSVVWGFSGTRPNIRNLKLPILKFNDWIEKNAKCCCYDSGLTIFYHTAFKCLQVR